VSKQPPGTRPIPLGAVPFIGPKRAAKLAKLGLETAGDLLRHFPRRHEDRRRFDHFPETETDQALCLCGRVAKTAVKRLGGRRKLFEATIEEGETPELGAAIICRWFNAHYVQKMVVPGQRLIVFGRPKRKGRSLVIDHPEFEAVEEADEPSIHLDRITPIHRATEGVSARSIRSMIHRLLAEVEPGAEGLLPADLATIPWGTAIRQIHFPEDQAELDTARRELILEECFRMQLVLAARRAANAAAPGTSHAGVGTLLEKLIANLPFPLTGAQRRAIAEIRRDLAAPTPMNRLLHGEVGSGKTVVALAAMLLCLESGSPATLMAPTQILAEQHYLGFRRWLEPLGVRVALRTGSRKEEAAPLPLFQQGPGASLPPILIGTHALLYEKDPAVAPGLVIIDEQHKFGVVQRAELIARGHFPDVLVMTATPIPRTLTMTLFGDLDVSTLDELPPGRGKITTAVRDRSKLPDAAKFLRDHLVAGRQAYIVYPLIDESESVAAGAAAAEFERWSDLLEPMRVELLHGRIPPAEKEAIMERFRSGSTKALVATQVIEVGIDVPNATILLVESAERFGLAQLHQLRGRVGRGCHRSFCILLAGTADPDALEKLAVLERTSDGFEIAEADLGFRGPGDLLGTAQSGLPPLRIGDPIQHADLMIVARDAARRIFACDPALEQPAHLLYRQAVRAEAGSVRPHAG
jgi:ATP-dependent DNA helicase RecG